MAKERNPHSCRALKRRLAHMTVQQERGLAAISSALKSAPYQRIAYKEFRALRDRFQYLMLLFLAGYNETRGGGASLPLEIL